MLYIYIYIQTYLYINIIIYTILSIIAHRGLPGGAPRYNYWRAPVYNYTRAYLIILTCAPNSIHARLYIDWRARLYILARHVYIFWRGTSIYFGAPRLYIHARHVYILAPIFIDVHAPIKAPPVAPRSASQSEISTVDDMI